MKAQPCILIHGQGYKPSPPEDATHLTIVLPGPTGRLTLPVQIKGRREGTGNWTWDGDTERPTLRPSVLTTNSRWRCHSWISDGAAQFLDDCTHDLRGQTVPLLDADCDHEWGAVDDSFDHEHGTERVVFERCEKCGAEQPHEPYDGPEFDSA